MRTRVVRKFIGDQAWGQGISLKPIGTPVSLVVTRAQKSRRAKPRPGMSTSELDPCQGHRHEDPDRDQGRACPPQNLIPVRVFVSMTPGIDRILSTTTWPRMLKSSASIFAIKSYSPKSG